ncbi:FxDxF family PEP-CTERM protein [Nitrosovibrio sp. Nv17]|uniref:FxDxF family PEP-CTERM protein n=1 Tax=Nitrosovibrio sp. Nv17 TaxID=1855339 RepID=UPI000908BC83|nr:FxDxF family PEP-CTERM protein [Nitrosovibrio sp. Nv17]SFW30085.1 PEP-CTERM protein-sorting domain-containing protein [Nitrosovibrio sp. Nv17]
MIRFTFKQAVVAAVLVGFGTGAQAKIEDLGAVTSVFPKAFNGTVLGSGEVFNDIFTFHIPEPHVGSGYSVIDFALDIGVGTFDTLLVKLSLYTNADGILGTGDEVLLKAVEYSSEGNSPNSLVLSWDQPIIGPAYLNVVGETEGTLGGLYNGAISVSPVPEAETYAMLLAGLGLMGAMVRRRNAVKRT